MKEEFDKDMNAWFPIIDRESEERQFRKRTEDYYFSGGNVDQELAALSKRIDEIIEENPGLVREKITLSQCIQHVPYEDWEEAVIIISYYTPETNLEYKKRVSQLKESERFEKEKILKQLDKYPDLVEEFIRQRKNSSQ